MSSNRKLTNVVFGANAPKLVRIITEELKKEEGVREGVRTRDVVLELTEMAPLEQERFEEEEKVRLEVEGVELEVKSKAVHERRLLVAESILEGLPFNGIVLIFPKAKEKWSSVLGEVWEPAGFKHVTTDRVVIDESKLEELLYFSETKFPDMLIKFLGPGPCLVHTIKYKAEEEVDLDDLLLSTIYGPSKCSPGSKDSPAQKLRCVVRFPENVEETVAKDENAVEEEEAENAVEVEEAEIDGVWVPPNRLCRAMAIKVLLPGTAASHTPIEPEPTPPYIAVSFDAFKRSDVMALIQEYPQEVMRFGFFTDENPETAKLIAKNVAQFEKKATETTYGEKMILQLSKKLSDTVLAFAQLGPSYMSTNSVEGARECEQFFPKGYDEPEVEEVEEVVKKKTGKRKKRAAAAAAPAEGASPVSSATEVSAVTKEDGETQEAVEGGEKPEDEGEGGEEEGELEEGEEVEEGEEGKPTQEIVADVPKEADKATSPMGEETPAISIAEATTAIAEAPTAIAEAPAAIAEAPAAIAEAPAAIAEAPAAIAEAPTAIAEAPTAIAEEPTAIAEAPTAIAEAPTAIAEAPTPSKVEIAAPSAEEAPIASNVEIPAPSAEAAPTTSNVEIAAPSAEEASNPEEVKSVAE